jgi:hypothetical protein
MASEQGLSQHGIAGKAGSFWTASSAKTEYAILSPDIKVDVEVTGGGFAGIASEVLLKRAGLKIWRPLKRTFRRQHTW